MAQLEVFLRSAYLVRVLKGQKIGPVQIVWRFMVTDIKLFNEVSPLI